MKIVIHLIALIIHGLIKIGDSVLLFLELIIIAIESLFKALSKFLNHLYFLIFRILKKIFSPFAFLKKIRRKRQFQPYIAKKPKPVYRVIYPLPLSVKFKYFIEGLIFASIFVFIPIFAFIFIQNLPKPQELTLRQIPQTTKIYDRNNVLLYQIYATQNRTLVPLSDIPMQLQQATIAIEDKDFYSHPGFNIFAIARSFIKNASGKELQGGSTITQQLIKSALLSPETTLNRKAKEVILAFWAERIYTKNQILEMYFNQIPYGGTAWGAESGAEIYFGKRVKDLDLAESAFLAGIPRAPTTYSPYGTNNNLWKIRQKEVLDRMVILKYISKDQEKQAKEEKLNFQPKENPIFAPHFVMYIKDLLVKKYGLPLVEKGGLIVKTSLDLKLQNTAQEIVADEVKNDQYLNLTNGAALVTNPQNGDILAMVGSKDYLDPNGGNVNVTDALRQPGSSIKVVTYSAALSRGFTPASYLDDSPITFPGPPGSPSYSPVNYDGKFRGKIPLRLALGNSLNIPAVKTLNQIGIPVMVNLGKEMGITTWNDPSQYGLSITLGGAEVKMVDMATVFGVLANQGERVDLNPILKVTDYQGDIFEEKDPSPKRVLDQGIAFIMSDILADNNARLMEFGPNSALYVPNYTVSVKTGTSDNKRDNWTIGYTKNKLVAVWVGNNDNSPMNPVLASGITGAAPIWNKIMTNVLTNSKDQKYDIPDDVVQKDCLGRKEYFIKGTEKLVSCTPLPPSVTPSPKP